MHLSTGRGELLDVQCDYSLHTNTDGVCVCVGGVKMGVGRGGGEVGWGEVRCGCALTNPLSWVWRWWSVIQWWNWDRSHVYHHSRVLHMHCWNTVTVWVCVSAHVHSWERGRWTWWCNESHTWLHTYIRTYVRMYVAVAQGMGMVNRKYVGTRVMYARNTYVNGRVSMTTNDYWLVGLELMWPQFTVPGLWWQNASNMLENEF